MAIFVFFFVIFFIRTLRDDSERILKKKSLFQLIRLFPGYTLSLSWNEMEKSIKQFIVKWRLILRAKRWRFIYHKKIDFSNFLPFEIVSKSWHQHAYLIWLFLKLHNKLRGSLYFFYILRSLFQTWTFSS